MVSPLVEFVGGVMSNGNSGDSGNRGRIPISSRPFDEYRDTPLWSAIEATIAELVATHELLINTAPAYVVGFICRELAAKRLIVSEALDK